MEKILLYQPGLVLLDIRIPGMSGTEVIQEVRHRGFEGEIIFLSGYTEFTYAQAALEYGAFKYITKPIDEGKLTDAVQAVKEKIERRYDKERSLNQYLKKARSMVLYDLLVGREFDPSINYNELGLYASIYQVVMYENYAPYFQMIDLASLLMIDMGSFERIQIHQREVLLLKNRNADLLEEMPANIVKKLLASARADTRRDLPWIPCFLSMGRRCPISGKSADRIISVPHS